MNIGVYISLAEKRTFMHTDPAAGRKEQLIRVAETFFQSLRNKSFSTIPFDDNIIMRVAFSLSGSNKPIHGKQSVHIHWWQMLERSLDGARINIFDHYINNSLTTIITEAEIILVNQSITLRVANRFTINEEGKIIELVNFVNAR